MNPKSKKAAVCGIILVALFFLWKHKTSDEFDRHPAGARPPINPQLFDVGDNAPVVMAVIESMGNGCFTIKSTVGRPDLVHPLFKVPRSEYDTDKEQLDALMALSPLCLEEEEMIATGLYTNEDTTQTLLPLEESINMNLAPWSFPFTYSKKVRLFSNMNRDKNKDKKKYSFLEDHLAQNIGACGLGAIMGLTIHKDSTNLYYIHEDSINALILVSGQNAILFPLFRLTPPWNEALGVAVKRGLVNAAVATACTFLTYYVLESDLIKEQD